MVMNGGHDGELQDGRGGGKRMETVVVGLVDGVVCGGGGGSQEGLGRERSGTKEERVEDEEDGSELREKKKGKVGRLDTRREKRERRGS